MFVWQACVFLLALAVFAEETPEQKKVDKRGLLGLGYGLAYVPAVVSSPAVSYTKVSSQQDASDRPNTQSGLRLSQLYDEYWDVE